MAIKTISQFPSGTPTNDDYILFEQNGEGKSAKFSDFSLSYEEIMATNPEPDLTGKVASAEAVKSIGSVVGEIYELESTNITNIPHATDCTLYEGLLPKGVYILTAKLYTNSSSCLIKCQNLRTQNVPTIYYTLSGLIESDGTSQIKIIFYQSTGDPISRPYDYDYVRLVRLK